MDIPISMDIPCISIGVDIHGISLDIPCISIRYIHGISMEWIYMVYPWIYHVYPSSIYMAYPWICMVYHLMYMQGIYVVYRGISMDIPSFLKPDFAAGPCCLSHSMRTRVWLIKSVLFHAAMAIAPGEKAAHKGSLPLLPRPPPPHAPTCLRGGS